ncbi:MAG: hypothetical protein VW450_01250 [Chloroflexota bacterium]
MHKRFISTVTILLALALGLVGLAACSGEDRPGSVSVDESGNLSGSVSGTGSTAGAGVVEPKPEGATQVAVSIGEWFIQLQSPTAPAGQVYFLVNNVGPNDPHELVIIRSDADPGSLPVVDGKVPEEQVGIVGEVGGFEPGTIASGLFDLAPGRYILICNIAEIEDGVLESHYQEGMYIPFEVL